MSNLNKTTDQTTVRALRRAALGLLFVLAGSAGFAHHPVLGKFDQNSPRSFTGIVTYVDWRNPHAHVFMNVTDNGGVVNWAVELESPIILRNNGWRDDSLQPGDEISVQGITARNGSRQIWGESVVLGSTGREVYSVTETRPVLPLASRPAPRWPDGQVALGATDSTVGGYWSYPSEVALVEDGVDVQFDQYGMLANIEDADNVAPLQEWALALYKARQQRFLQDDPMYLHCKPPGGPRQYQSPLGIQLLEDRQKERVFILMGGGNHNFRIAYLDGRDPAGQLGGDDDNPLYYGRSVGSWDGDTLVLSTTGFNEDFWFTNGGLPHTSQLEMEERFTRTDFDTLHYEVIINDPGAYTRAWTASWELQWVGGEELPVHFCQNNRP